VKVMTGPASEIEVPGDPEAGERVFRGAKAGCAECHSIRGQGGRMGPDLTDVGASRPYALIKESIVGPFKRLQLAGQEGVLIRLKNGKEIQGVARNRNNYSLQVLDRQGNLHLVSMLDVEQLTISARSLMPDDYGRRLSAQELQNLYAFLARQALRPRPAPEEMSK
jgi:cytochrome c oxidase cbb3-type subunit 3